MVCDARGKAVGESGNLLQMKAWGALNSGWAVYKMKGVAQVQRSGLSSGDRRLFIFMNSYAHTTGSNFQNHLVQGLPLLWFTTSCDHGRHHSPILVLFYFEIRRKLTVFLRGKKRQTGCHCSILAIWIFFPATLWYFILPKIPAWIGWDRLF